MQSLYVWPVGDRWLILSIFLKFNFVSLHDINAKSFIKSCCEFHYIFNKPYKGKIEKEMKK